jgi:hypothetical protein
MRPHTKTRADEDEEKKEDENETDEKRSEDDEEEKKDDSEKRSDDEEEKEKTDDERSARSVDLIFSTGAGVLRRDDSGNEYLEVLSLDPSAVDLSRLNSGAAPLLNSHASDGLNNILGVIERAWVDPKTNNGVARVRFSRRPDVEPILQDVRDKIIISTSVGYTVERWEDITKEGDEIPTRLVTKWIPHEISLVGIPADQNSRVIRKTHKQRMEMKVLENQSKADVVSLERKRGLDIRRAVKAANLPENFADNLIERGFSMTEASETIINELTKPKPNSPNIIGHSPAYAGSLDEVDSRRRGIENAILHKMSPEHYKLNEMGRRYMGNKLVDYAKIATRGYSSEFHTSDYNSNPIDTFSRAFNGSMSDFPAILANVLNKELRRGFESAPSTWEAFCRKTTVNNLKPIQRPQLGEAPLMEKVNEQGEYRRGSISETNQTYELQEYGKIMSLSLRVLLDDDLAAFSRIPALMGRAAQDQMSEHFYHLLGNNPMLRDGNTFKPLFDPSNKNMAPAGNTITIDSLSAGRTAMRQQTGQAGRILNLLPKWILVPSCMEATAEQFLSQNLLAGQIQAVTQQMINPFAGKLNLIVEPRLDQYSKTAWYLVADLGQIDICEVAYLNGQESPMIISRDGFTSSGIEWRINHWFGFGFIEHRSWYQFPKLKTEK